MDLEGDRESEGGMVFSVGLFVMRTLDGLVIRGLHAVFELDDLEFGFGR